MQTGPTANGSSGDATALFGSALGMYRRGDERLAYQAATVLLEENPGHVGGMMLLLASAGGCGDELTISTALLGVARHYGRLLAVPEVLELFDSDLMAPVVGSHTFRAVFAPALRAAQRRTCEASDREMARLVQEAVRDASVETVLLAAPVLGEPPVEEGGEGPCLVDVAGELVAALHRGRAYLAGRANGVDIRLAHRSVSRRHFLLEHHRGAWAVKNLSATNRTQVNGRPVDGGWTRLQEGDELRAGEVPLDFVPAESVFPKAPEPVAEPSTDPFARTLSLSREQAKGMLQGRSPDASATTGPIRPAGRGPGRPSA